MKRTVLLFAFLLFASFSFAQAAEAKKAEAKKEAVKAEDTTLKVSYKNGLTFESADGNFSATVGGRVQHDWIWGRQNPNGAAPNQDAYRDGAGFRRLRFGTAGSIFKNIGYKLELDFAGEVGTNSGVTLADVYISMTIPKFKKFLNIKVGHFKEPFGLEELTSSRFVTFMERSSVSDIFAPSRNTGIMVYGTPSPMFTYALGFFWEGASSGRGDDNRGPNFAARFTTAPMYDKKSGKVVHLGLSYSYRYRHPRMRSRLGVTSALNAPRVVDTGGLFREANSIDLEVAAVFGPFSFQAEFALGDVNIPLPANDAGVWAYYLQVSFFVTGEHRPYNVKKGVFGRVKPKKNFLQDGGLGALEVALRFDQAKLDSGPFAANLAGGEGYSITLGANWYLFSNVRISANYVSIYADSSVAGVFHAKVNIFQMRFQVDF